MDSLSNLCLGALLLCLSLHCASQQIDYRGSCEVTVSGNTELNFSGHHPAPDGKKGDTRMANILWMRAWVDEMKAKAPQAASVYDNMLRMPGTLFGLGCGFENGSVTISSLGYEMDPDDFAGKTGTYPLVGTNVRGEQPPGMLTGFMGKSGDALITITPSQPGELHIREFSETEIEGSFNFKSDNSIVNGTFAFERIPAK